MINNLKPLTDKNAQLVTRYIKNWADSAKFQVCSSHLTLCGLTVNRSEMPNFSYTHPLNEIGRKAAPSWRGQNGTRYFFAVGKIRKEEYHVFIYKPVYVQ